MIRWLLAILLVAVSPTLSSPAKVVHPVQKPVEVRSSDDRCLAWVLWSEARGEPLQGARAVYDVVKYRMEVRGLTACEVVMQRGQFSGYRRGMKMRVSGNEWDRLTKVRKMPTVVRKAEYFHADYVQPTWAERMQRVKQVGKHVFLKKPKEKRK